MPRARSTTLGLIGLCAVLVIGAAVAFVLRQSSETPPRQTDDGTQRPAEQVAVESAQPPHDSGGERTAVPTDEGEPPLPPLPIVTVRGRVVDASGTPVPEIEVGVLLPQEDAPIRSRSDGSGSFLLAATEFPCSIVVVDPKWTTLSAGEVTEAAPLAPAVVVAAPAVSVSGVVVDPEGRPLAGARLGIRVVGRTSPARSEWGSESAADGSFSIARAPRVSAARLSTRLAEFKTDERTLDLPPPERLRIVLVPAPLEGPVLTGIVVRSDGAPVSGATVSFGSARVRTDVHGRFRLVCGWYDEGTPLVAAARRSSPTVLAGYGARVERLAAEHPVENIVLPEASLSISGRVILSSGTSAKGWRVALDDPTPLDPGGVAKDFVEGLGGDRNVPRTDGSGGFEIHGLADRPYTLLAFGRDRSSGAEVAVRSDPVPAGTRDVVLQAPDGNPGAVISGRVLTMDGAPVAGARVGLGWPHPPGAESVRMQGRFRTVSDLEGRFEILGVPEGLASLAITKEGFLPTTKSLETDSSRSNLLVSLREQRQFSFDGSDASPPPDLLRLISIQKPAWSLRLDGGRLDGIAVGEDVREIVLYRGSLEIGRVGLSLSRDGITRVVWP